MLPSRRLPLLLGTLCLAAGCGGTAVDDVRVLTGASMGSSWEVKWHGSADPVAVRNAVLAELDLADTTFSTWGKDSELQRFNAWRSNAPFAASDLLREAVALGLAVAAASDGAFDPTVKPLSDVYRAAKAGVTPLDPQALAAARARIDHRALHVVGTTLVKDRADLELDLDGLVAGLCADRMGARLRALGVAGCMLQITGEVLCLGRKPDGSNWRIGIDDPDSPVDLRTASVTLPVLDAAVTTSGDYRNFVLSDGKVFSHVFDPRTAQSPAHRVVSVSVLARSCALADALDTALLVTGPAGAAAVIARCAEPLAGAWFVLADAEGELRSETVGWPEAFRLDGRPLPLIPLPEGERALAEHALEEAARWARESPEDAAAAFKHGCCLAAVGRHRDAVAAWSRGQELGPFLLLRHLGEAHIILRDFTAAERDLARAAALARSQQDSWDWRDPFSPRRARLTTLHYQVHFHLGLARFLLGEFAGAEAAFRDCLATAKNDPSPVAIHWLWCALMRQDKRTEAAAVLGGIGVGMKVPEDDAYYRLCRFYRGDVSRAEITAGAIDLPLDLAFGLAHHDLVAGDRASAEAALRQLANSASWTAIGVIAAETEVMRLRLH